MALGWTSVGPALVELFTELSREPSLNSDGYSASWQERAQKAMHDRQQRSVQLKVLSVATVGEDESVWEYDAAAEVPGEDPPAGGIREVLLGHRRFMLQVTARTVSNTDASWAAGILDRVATRLRRRSSLDALLAVNVALVRTEPVRDVTVSFDDRRTPQAVLDVVLVGAFSDQDPVPVGWFERIELTSHVEDAAGDEISAGLQLDELPVPPSP